jgi:putative phosphoribosyl transferase
MDLYTRSEAGRRLAKVLAPWESEQPLIFALSPGAARVAFEVAQRFGAPLDLVSARKLEVPGRRRSAFGAVTPRSMRISRPQMKALALPKPYLKDLVQREEREAMLEERVLRGAAEPLELEGRLVILIDDGLADPMVMSAGIASLRARHPARLFLAVPFASPELKLAVRRMVDRLVVDRESDDQPAMLICDECFIQTTWEDVRRMVELSRQQAELLPA